MTLVEQLQNLSLQLDLSPGHIPESVEKIKKALSQYELSFKTPEPGSMILLIGGGSGTAVVGRSLYQAGINDFTMLANTGEVQRDKETLEVVGAGLIFIEIPEAIEYIDITKQSIHATPTEQRTEIHDLLDMKVAKSMRLGYLVIEALRQHLNDAQKAVDYINFWMKNPYRVIPTTTDRVEIFFKLGGKELTLYEYALREDVKNLAEDFVLKPKATLSKEAEQAIQEAKAIVIGPGDVFFSVLPHWKVGNFKETLAGNEQAKIILITNLTARSMDIPDYKVSDVLALFDEYIPQNREVVALVNSGQISEINPLVDDISGEVWGRYQIKRADIASDILDSNKQLIHNEKKLGSALLNVIQEA